MSAQTSEFWDRLIRSGVADFQRCQQLADEYAQHHDGTPPTDVLSLARYLIRRKVLTPQQAKSLLSGTGTASGEQASAGDPASQASTPSSLQGSSAQKSTGSPAQKSTGEGSDFPQIVTEPRTSGSRAKPRASKQRALLVRSAMVIVVAGVLVATAALIGWSNRNSGDAIEQAANPEIDQTQREISEKQDLNSPTTDPATEKQEPYRLVADDRLLYVPPSYEPSSPSLEFLAPGPAAIVSLNLSTAAPSSADAFSTSIEPIIDYIGTRGGVATSNIRRCTIGLYPGQSGQPEAAFVVELKSPTPIAALVAGWNARSHQRSESGEIYLQQNPAAEAYYVDRSIEDPTLTNRFAVGSLDQMVAVTELEGGAIVLPPRLQSLWDASSVDAGFVALVTPNFLFADGRSMMQSTTSQLIQPLRALLIPDVVAFLVTGGIDGELVYVETRLLPGSGVTEIALAEKLRDAIESWPGWADQFVVSSTPDVSWRLLASRIPSMIRFTVDHVRTGISDGFVIANLYLPRRAAHQVAIASALALRGQDGDPGPAQPPMATPRTAATANHLDRPLTVSFEQESLEMAIETVVAEFSRTLPPGTRPLEIRIVGSDLQKAGITRNQQIRDFSARQVPLRELLTGLVVRANPTASGGPTDPAQTLVWVETNDSPEDAAKLILITTRPVAEQKYELPAEFVSDP